MWVNITSWSKALIRCSDEDPWQTVHIHHDCPCPPIAELQSWATSQSSSWLFSTNIWGRIFRTNVLRYWILKIVSSVSPSPLIKSLYSKMGGWGDVAIKMFPLSLLLLMVSFLLHRIPRRTFCITTRVKMFLSLNVCNTTVHTDILYTLSQRKSTFRDITWNGAGKTWYYEIFHVAQAFLYISCYIAEILIAFLTVQCRGKHNTTWNIPRSMAFPLGQCIYRQFILNCRTF